MPNIEHIQEFKEAIAKFHASNKSAEDYMNFIALIMKLAREKNFMLSNIVTIIEKTTNTKFGD